MSHIIEGGRHVEQKHCYCRCHDRVSEISGNIIWGVPRDDESAAATACDLCRWAHAVAFSTADWSRDERYTQPPKSAIDTASDAARGGAT